MKINPLKTIVTENGIFPPGVVFDIDDKTGKELIDMNAAILITVKEPKKKT
jgi:hypothetical protein